MISIRPCVDLNGLKQDVTRITPQTSVRTLLGCYGRPIDRSKCIPQKYAGFEEKCVNLMTGSKKENIGLIATKCGRLIEYLEAKDNILLLATSTRYRNWTCPLACMSTPATAVNVGAIITGWTRTATV